jgi:hypothetical protein
VDTEAGAEIMLQYENGITASLHLNYYEKSKERFLKLVFDDASFSVDFFEASLTKKGKEKLKPDISLISTETSSSSISWRHS